MLKCPQYSYDDEEAKWTLAMCWVFRKKAFYVSGQFHKALSDLIIALCSSKTRRIQVDLFKSELKANSRKMLSFISSTLSDFDVEI